MADKKGDLKAEKEVETNVANGEVGSDENTLNVPATPTEAEGEVPTDESKNPVETPTAEAPEVEGEEVESDEDENAAPRTTKATTY